MKLKNYIALTVITMITLSLLTPLFIQWYEQKTGIYPISFIMVIVVLTLINSAYIISRFINETLEQ